MGNQHTVKPRRALKNQGFIWCTAFLIYSLVTESSKNPSSFQSPTSWRKWQQRCIFQLQTWSLVLSSMTLKHLWDKLLHADIWFIFPSPIIHLPHFLLSNLKNQLVVTEGIITISTVVLSYMALKCWLQFMAEKLQILFNFVSGASSWGVLRAEHYSTTRQFLHTTTYMQSKLSFIFQNVSL